jgi:antitoxin ParD1/3/4
MLVRGKPQTITMPNQNVNLSVGQAKFIRQSIDRGRFSSASEMVRAGLQLLEEQGNENKLKLRALRRMAKKAFDEIDRGECVVVEPENIDKFINLLDRRARALIDKRSKENKGAGLRGGKVKVPKTGGVVY